MICSKIFLGDSGQGVGRHPYRYEIDLEQVNLRGFASNREKHSFYSKEHRLYFPSSLPQSFKRRRLNVALTERSPKWNQLLLAEVCLPISVFALAGASRPFHST
jgi:hypothetical protein